MESRAVQLCFIGVEIMEVGAKIEFVRKHTHSSASPRRRMNMGVGA